MQNQNLPQKRRIALLGSTGSIGVQCLNVVKSHPQLFEIEILTANQNVDLLIRQALEFEPNAVVIANEAHYQRLKDALAGQDIKVYAGLSSIASVVQWDSVDIVLNAIVGFSGLEPSIRSLEAGKILALANKESLVAGGNLVMRTAAERHSPIIPVDSEHSAIFQCLQGEISEPQRLLLTASGGPFRTLSAKEMETITPEQALRHPTWQMGAKVTVDSATMMNKGLEIIEAFHLFGLPASRIEVVVHPQSVVHSMVEFADGSVKAQLGSPDMRIPIQYALTYPYRQCLDVPRLDFAALKQLDFFAPDPLKFPAISLAYRALNLGGNKACCLNAANEVAVEAFLKHGLAYNHIVPLVEAVMDQIPFVADPELEQLKESHKESLLLAQNLLKTKRL